MVEYKRRAPLLDTSRTFNLARDKTPRGDQPAAIDSIVKGLRDDKNRRMTLLGVTGSGKTFTVANIISQLQRPTLVLAHNKTLAAQLYSEFTEFFPENAVRYFVSYYDYYQPEAYVVATDTYIEKDASINEEIDKLRHAATKALLERRDVIVVASVSCIYGLGDPDTYFEMMLYVEAGDQIDRKGLLQKLVFLQYQRNDMDFATGTFRVRGDTVEVCTADESDIGIRFELFGDELERITEFDRLTGKSLRNLNKVCIYPASHFVTGEEALNRAILTIGEELEARVAELQGLGKNLEADRLAQRTRYDIELLKEMGFCPGIENYSRHLTGRAPGEPPPTLIDYFPEDFLVVIDESHVSVSQIGGMFRGDRSRKQNLVDHGFRLPSALDNRPLTFEEFQEKALQAIYVSATPGRFEIEDSKGKVVEQVIRPTGLIDPRVEIRPALSQVDDFLVEVQRVSNLGERALVTTLTKRMAEDLTEYYQDLGVRVKYLHSDIHTLDRVDIIRALRNGEFDLLVGINLLREGLDLPEVSLVGIMDADKEGFLRSETSLIQTIGRAARNINGFVILYADKETDSIKRAILETNRRRCIQEDYNKLHGIIPSSVSRKKEVEMIEVDYMSRIAEEVEPLLGEENLPKDIFACQKLINEVKKEMFEYSRQFEFEKAAVMRDKLKLLERLILTY
ncbi:MAG TPA: excinuclease ABC subunit UvrB [Oligoflexia bacterium]|nr:excinuclease ABC subunit UvrB [Oligoflexia bacterium]HMP48073.1 excinuclease ABC subunit UvrB [Oligoflexia bacterium]